MHVLEMRGVVKRFGALTACDHVDFTINPGEVHALLGENGAGKSTLMRLLYGLYRLDDGQFYLEGEPIDIASPHDAIAFGIGMVHQHFLLVPTMTVLENCLLGRSRLLARISFEETLGEMENVRDRYGLWVEPHRRVADLPVGLQQRAEIIRALAHGARLLILDEPTAVLTPLETDVLFEGLRRFAEEGNSMVVITHKLKEVMAVSDRVSVMRGGRIVGDVRTKDTDAHRLAEMMTGTWQPSALARSGAGASSGPGREVLAVRDLTVLSDEGHVALRALNFDVRSGEILGVAGVDGNGQAELAQVLVGLRRPASGSICLNGRNITGARVDERLELGIGHIPDDRHRWGLFLDMSVKDNLVTSSLGRPSISRFGMVRSNEVKSLSAQVADDFEIVPPDPESAAGSLSGGNQQKVVVAREVRLGPTALVAAQPTRGLDIMAADFVRNRLIAERDRGAAVLLLSADLAEVMALSDRVAVMYEGQFVDTVDAGVASIEQIGRLMAGLHPAGGLSEADRHERVAIDETDLL